MNKKKIEELVREVIKSNIDSLEFGNDKHNAPLRKANSLLNNVLAELSKSDWISVEDELPEYNEDVLVCNKTYPIRIFNTTRLEGVCNRNHNFIIQRMYVTHWRRIEKLNK